MRGPRRRRLRRRRAADRSVLGAAQHPRAHRADRAPPWRTGVADLHACDVVDRLAQPLDDRHRDRVARRPLELVGVERQWCAGTLGGREVRMRLVLVECEVRRRDHRDPGSAGGGRGLRDREPWWRWSPRRSARSRGAGPERRPRARASAPPTRALRSCRRGGCLRRRPRQNVWYGSTAASSSVGPSSARRQGGGERPRHERGLALA